MVVLPRNIRPHVCDSLFCPQKELTAGALYKEMLKVQYTAQWIPDHLDSGIFMVVVTMLKVESLTELPVHI